MADEIQKSTMFKQESIRRGGSRQGIRAEDELDVEVGHPPPPPPLPSSQPPSSNVQGGRPVSITATSGTLPIVIIQSIPVASWTSSGLEAWITRRADKSHKTYKPEMIDNGDGTITVKYEPREEGLHELHLQRTLNPLQFHVEPLRRGHVSAFGSGLTAATVGTKALFTVHTDGAGPGGLSVTTEGPAKCEIKCTDNRDGTVSVAYLPTAAGHYRIFIKFAGQEISGSPFEVHVADPMPDFKWRCTVSSRSPSPTMREEIKEEYKEIKRDGRTTKTERREVRELTRISSPEMSQLNNLTAILRSPSGREEICSLKTLPSGSLGISFTPKEIGDHLVYVRRSNGRDIDGSPFTVCVEPREIGDPSRVHVSGRGILRGQVNGPNEFLIDTTHAGYGGLSISIEGPSKADIQVKSY